MTRFMYSLPARNWRVVVAVASLVLFALAGSANDPDPM